MKNSRQKFLSRLFFTEQHQSCEHAFRKNQLVQDFTYHECLISVFEHITFGISRAHQTIEDHERDSSSHYYSQRNNQSAMGDFQHVIFSQFRFILRFHEYSSLGSVTFGICRSHQTIEDHERNLSYLPYFFSNEL